jgi:ectoine hydroxylase-related dioxygenase (phytanoyl-CoA dioxygenase family)
MLSMPMSYTDDVGEDGEEDGEDGSANDRDDPSAAPAAWSDMGVLLGEATGADAVGTSQAIGRRATSGATGRAGTLFVRRRGTPMTSTDTTPVDVKAHARRIADEGYTIVEGAIEPELVDALNDDLLRLERELGVTPANNDFEGRSTVRIYNLLVHGPNFERIPVHPNVLPIVERVLDPGCLVSSLSSIAIDPGETAQPIHADDQLIPLPKPHPPTVCNTMWALTDFTDENGATRIIPGTHLADHNPDYFGSYESIPAEMPKGSVMIWHGSLWHGGGANRSQQRRVGIAMNYCAGYIRQQENQQLGIPRPIARRFEPRLRELVGYSVYNALIGHIDKRNPAFLLDDDDAGGDHRMVWDV